jgi:pimeloyl-ACP methyl ester carboxylesterase
VTDSWQHESSIDVGGHTLVVREAGDADGVPIVYFHGTPSCRLEPAFADGLAAELGVRLVAFDRPGYGDSPFVPFSLASIARDTGVVADALGIDRFVATGQSGGGAFSLACGAVLGHRVARVGVTSGVAPFREVPGLLDMLDENDTAADALLPDEEAAARQFAVGFEPFRELGRGTDAEIIAGFKTLSSRRDSELLDRPELASSLAASVRLALANGTSGAGRDNVFQVGPWDIDLDAIQQPVFLWYGDEDTFAPPVMGEWLGQRLPTATLVMRQGEGHLGVMDHTREILETLIGDRG